MIREILQNQADSSNSTDKATDSTDKSSETVNEQGDTNEPSANAESSNNATAETTRDDDSESVKKCDKV